MEFHGDEGSLFLRDWHNFDGAVEYAGCGETIRDADTRYERLPYVREPYTGDLAADLHAGVEWSRAVLDMAEAIREGRPPRTTRAQAAHVVDIVTAILETFGDGRRVTITSEFPQPAPIEWAT